MRGSSTPPDRGRLSSPDWHHGADMEQPTTSPTAFKVQPVPRATPERRATLVLLTGLEAGKCFVLERAETIVGRDRAAEVRIDDGGTSRRHCRILREGDRYVLEDLDSRNGTYINGERVPRLELRPGDRIAVSPNVVLRFAIVDDAEEKLARQLFEASTRDALTGAFNRRYLNERIAAEMAFAHRHEGQLGLLLFDIDHFKTVNDTHGHLAGDAVLRAIVQRVLGLIRAEDVLARWGGEEFLVMVRGVQKRGVIALAERIRGAVARMELPHNDRILRFTVSVGVATLDDCDAGATGDLLLAVADDRMYQAKLGGRNRVRCD